MFRIVGFVLLAHCLAGFALGDEAISPKSGNEYILTVPGNWAHWFLASAPIEAWQIYIARERRTLFDLTTANIDDFDEWPRYETGTRAVVMDDSHTGISKVGFKTAGEELNTGWVANDLLSETPESIARMKVKAAAEAKRQREEAARAASVRAERAAEIAREKAAVRAFCGRLYEQTANKRVADLTVKEEEQVRTCQAVGLYRAPQLKRGEL